MPKQDPTMLKRRVKQFVQNAYSDHKNAVEALDKIVANRGLTGTFGDSRIEDVKRAESLVNVLNFDLEYVNGDEFNALTEDELYTHLQDVYREMHTRERGMTSKGMITRNVWTLSGVFQYSHFLEELLNDYAAALTQEKA